MRKKKRNRAVDAARDEKGGHHHVITKKENDLHDSRDFNSVDIINRIKELESDMQEAKEYSHLTADALELLYDRLEKLETLVLNFFKLHGIDVDVNETPIDENVEKLESEADNGTSASNLVYL